MLPDFEVAMTHLPGAGQRACPRPDAVLTMADRVRRWLDAPEGCAVCGQGRAVVVRSGEPLCAACRMTVERRSVAESVASEERMDPEPATGAGFEGHAIVFDALSLDLGGFREKIAPGAVDRTLRENLDVRALWNHDSAQPIGRLSANTLALRADGTGLLVQILPPSWAHAQVESVERRDVTGMSFGFRALDDEWMLEGPVPIRTVLDMRVSEVSIVSFPAYPSTDVRVAEALALSRGSRLAWLERWHKTRLVM